jgi:large subunit ribosomal protein L10
MNRQQKETVVTDFKRFFDETNAAFLVNYKGLTVAQMQSLRKDLRDCDGLLKVAKARLMKIAANEVDGASGFKDKFQDQVGLVFAKGEVPAVAKQLVKFSKANDSLSIVSGFFESNELDVQQITTLASLPSKEVLLGMLAGTLQAPISGFARVLQLLIVRLLYVLKQVGEQKEQGNA